MDMFGGLTKTSSRIAIAAALGFTLGGFAFSATPARAADLGGDCCADLEERVAELEATTVRKGNKKVSVTISGWVVKSMNYWDDGDIDHFVVGDKDYDLGSRFAITGSATISPGLSAGYNLTINTWATAFGTGSNQINDLGSPTGANGNIYGDIATLYSYIYIKSDTFGALNWGHLSPASDNPAVLADISGTVIETNGVWFEGPGFFLRPKGGGKNKDLSGLTWSNFLLCQGLGAGIGVDCWGVAQPAVRYDSPTWGGFRFEASYGKNQATGAFDTPDSDFADIAVFYTADWNSIKVSAAAAYTWIETGVVTGTETDLFQAGGSIMHKPSGLGIYAMGQWEESGGSQTTGLGLDAVTLDSLTVGVPLLPAISINADVIFTGGGAPFVSQNNPDTDAWYVKPFWRWAGSANGVGLGTLGATTFYAEYGQYNDQFAAGTNLCSFVQGGGNLGNFCAPTALTTGPLPPGGAVTLELSATSVPGDIFQGAFVTGSEAERWGLGVVQEIDSAAMHLWARWQHQELETNIVGVTVNDPLSCSIGSAGALTADCSVSTKKIKQDWDDWDLFQVGGIIFF
jgi:Gram-negative porin